MARSHDIYWGCQVRPQVTNVVLSLTRPDQLEMGEGRFKFQALRVS